MESRHGITVVATVLFRMLYPTQCSVDNFEIVRGVPIQNAKLYAPAKDFLCLDGSYTIPYSYINDDYCDCLDASDEPGTSACPNGTFYCANVGHMPLILPSSRINDGICDCCDGSDEWANNIQKGACQNTCEELGLEAKKEAIRINKLYAQGFELRAQLITKGNYILNKKKKKIFELLSKMQHSQYIRNNLFIDKRIYEEKEKKALDEEKLKKQNEAIKYFMENKKELDLNDFISDGWNRVNLLIFTQSKLSPTKTKDLNQDNIYHNVNNETKHNTIDVEAVITNELLYTKKTKLIINESKRIRQLFETVDKKIKDIEKQISGLQKSINKNFGPENEFVALDGQCYKLIDHLYIYELCLFEKVTQRSKMGGPEVNLGVWNNWIKFVGTNELKYHTMLYDKGDNCLNQIQRFTFVHLSCGLEPKLISVTEPNRCEYLMEFELPSVCVIQDAKYSRVHIREEL